jgi:predicted acetyltransferase
MTHRCATLEDAPKLAELNFQLIEDENYRVKRSIPELQERMERWLATGGYRAILFDQNRETVAYALYSESDSEIYLRQLFVLRTRRRQGLGRKAMSILRKEIWPKDKRLTVEVLVGNLAAVTFWRAVGYKDYSLLLEILPS